VLKVISKISVCGSLCVIAAAIVACSSGGREVAGSTSEAIVPVSPAWQGWESLSGGLATDPTIVAEGTNRLAVFATDPNGSVWQRYYQILQWAPTGGGWLNLGNRGNPVGAPAAVVVNGNQIEMFVIDSVTHHLLHQEAIGYGYQGGNYPAWNAAGWEDLGGNLAQGKPTVVVSQPGNQVNVFVRNADDSAATMAVHGYASHGGWVSLSGVISFEPGAASWGANRLDVFVGAPNYQLYHRYSVDNGATWWPAGGSWEGLGGSVAATPSVTSWGSNRLDVVVTSTDASINHVAWTGTSWGGCSAPPCWSKIPGVAWADPQNLFAPPTTVTTGVGNLQLFIQGTDRGLYTYSMSGSDAQGNPTWAASSELATCFVSAGAASVISRDGTTLDVVVTAFGLSGDTSVWHAATAGGELTFNGMSTATPPPACACGGVGQACCDDDTCSNGDTEACLPQSLANIELPYTCQSIGGNGQTCRPNPTCRVNTTCPPPPPSCDGWLSCSNQNKCQPCGGDGQIVCNPGFSCMDGYSPVESSGGFYCQPPCGTQLGGECCPHTLWFRNTNVSYPTCGGTLTCNSFGSGSGAGVCVACGHAGELCCDAWTSPTETGTCTDGSTCDSNSDTCKASSSGGCNGTFTPYVPTFTSPGRIAANETFSMQIDISNYGCASRSVQVYGLVQSADDGSVTKTNVDSVTVGGVGTTISIPGTFTLDSGSYKVGVQIVGFGFFYAANGLCIGDADCASL
jgi:hypothetical protein